MRATAPSTSPLSGCKRAKERENAIVRVRRRKKEVCGWGRTRACSFVFIGRQMRLKRTGDLLALRQVKIPKRCRPLDLRQVP